MGIIVVSNLSCTIYRIKFTSNGLPHHSHALMKGITGTNQGSPAPHDFKFAPNGNEQLFDRHLSSCLANLTVVSKNVFENYRGK